MRSVWAFLGARRAALAIWLLTVLVVLTMGFLARQDMSYVRYSVLLISFVACAALLADFLVYRSKRRALAAIRLRTELLPESLPEPPDALSADYDALIRALKLENEALAAAYKRAMDEQKTYYTLWAHQIKTPIAATRLLLGVMEGENVLLVRQEQHKIEQYVDLALKYVKLERIANELAIERCDLNEVVKGVVRRNSLLFAGGKLSLTVDVPHLDVPTDAFWLSFIIEQLLANAVKYTHRGGVRIAYASGELVVADTGVGIRKEDLPRIFDRGYTGYNGRMDSRASGIGLYLVKRAADALRITIRVASEFGAGTQVFVKLPQQDELAAQT